MMKGFSALQREYIIDNIPSRRVSVDSAKLNLTATYSRMEEAILSLESPDEILEACLSVIIEELETERGFIMLYDSNFDELNVFAAHNIDPDTIFTTAEVSQTILNSVYHECKPIMSYNALDDPRFSEKSSVVISGLRSILCVPITVQEGLLGVVYVDDRLRIGAFDQRQLQFLCECSKKLSEIMCKVFPEIKPKAFKK
jgi:GAF domain-containing protein